MRFPSVTPRAARLLGIGAIAATIALGILLRLVDPLSTSVIPAEDPYAHMVMVKEHLQTATLDPLNPNGGLYPPGMHAFLAAIWTFSGLDLYQTFRFAPVVLGGIGVLGMGMLLWRHAGPIAGFVGALGYAVAPELIFRTTMMSPTALDLAIVPVLLYAALEVVEGDLRWLGVAVPMTLFLVFAHPWIFGILAVFAGLLVVFSILAPGSTAQDRRASLRGMTLLLAVLGGGLALAMTGCRGMCGPGLNGFLPEALKTGWAVPAVFAGSVLPAAIVAIWPERTSRLLSMDRREPTPWWLRALASVGLAGALFLVTAPAVQQGMPPHVDLPRMIGWPVLASAAIAFVALPFIPNRAAHAGASFCIATYPWVIYNPLNSPFWSHRTAAFLGIGLMILLGVAALAGIRWSRRALASWQPKFTGARPQQAATTLFAVPALLVAVSMGGAVYAGTPDGYEGGWYRLYQPCELNAFEEMAERFGDEPRAYFVTGAWQARLVLAAVSEYPTKVQTPWQFTTHEQSRNQIIGSMEKADRPLYMVVDRHLYKQQSDVDLSFLEGEDWQQVGHWCDGTGPRSPHVTLYAYQGAPR